MVAFFLQTLLLLAAAYLLGCMVSCVIRRSLYAPRPRAVERRVDPLPEVLARGDVRFAETVAPPAPREVAPAPLVRPAATAEPVPAPAAETVAAAAAAASAASSVVAVAAAPSAAQAQDLKRIRLIDVATEGALNKLGITRYEQIALWTRADVQRMGQELSIKGRINQENWIEQAAILAKSGETYYSARRARGETATAAPTAGDVASPVPPDAGGLPRPMSRVGVAAAVVAPPTTHALSTTSPQVAERAAFAASTGAAVPIRPAPPAGSDNLQRIGNITPDIEQALNASGIMRYAQIAQWSPADVERFEKQLLASERISRENWIEQAQILSRGGDTRFSREFDARSGAGAPPPNGGAAPRRTDLGALRSVRSPAFRDTPEPGPEAAERLAAQNKVPRATDDLKRIRGVGVLIEKKLNGMGISSYEQIANWTADDIDRVSRSLDFKGRIERENWVEQARILSAGGQTEFSRRVDRGEVETSRAKT
jgi:predicted flap endonuclease-1-like 5' DNA nuclease